MPDIVIERLLRDEDPVIKELAEITHNIFKKIAHKLTSTTLKQNFQKLLKFFYIKKLKPLYNYNSPNGQIDSPTDSEYIKNDKEGLREENDDDILNTYIIDINTGSNTKLQKNLRESMLPSMRKKEWMIWTKDHYVFEFCGKSTVDGVGASSLTTRPHGNRKNNSF
ncbi:hypothetical protein AAY473_038206 [Plecturocebus cupreus]